MLLLLVGKTAHGGGKTYPAIFGGEAYYRARPPKPVAEASRSWSVHVSSTEHDRAWKGGGTYHRWGGGSKTAFGEGFDP